MIAFVATIVASFLALWWFARKWANEKRRRTEKIDPDYYRRGPSSRVWKVGLAGAGLAFSGGLRLWWVGGSLKGEELACGAVLLGFVLLGVAAGMESSESRNRHASLQAAAKRKDPDSKLARNRWTKP